MICFIITCTEFYFRTAMLVLISIILETFLSQSADNSLWWITPKAKCMLAVAPLIAAGRDITEALSFWKLQFIY